MAHVTRDMWHMTHDTWHMTHDTHPTPPTHTHTPHPKFGGMWRRPLQKNCIWWHRQTNKQTDRHTDGHGDSMTDPAQRAESVKSAWLVKFYCDVKWVFGKWVYFPRGWSKQMEGQLPTWQTCLVCVLILTLLDNTWHTSEFATKQRKINLKKNTHLQVYTCL